MFEGSEETFEGSEETFEWSEETSEWSEETFGGSEMAGVTTQQDLGMEMLARQFHSKRSKSGGGPAEKGWRCCRTRKD